MLALRMHHQRFEDHQKIFKFKKKISDTKWFSSKNEFEKSILNPVDWKLLRYKIFFKDYKKLIYINQRDLKSG